MSVEGWSRVSGPSFNEAAAYSRGKRRGSVDTWRYADASFNEAAAYSRGKRLENGLSSSVATALQ